MTAEQIIDHRRRARRLIAVLREADPHDKAEIYRTSACS